MRPAISLVFLVCSVLGGPAASRAHSATVVQKESVRFEYARVLKVTPVFQTLTASRVEQRCEPDVPADSTTPVSRVVGAVRQVLKHDGAETPASTAAPSKAATGPRGCRMVQVERQFRRPIAYDVDYTHRGANYRSRMPDDPGSLLRIRVSVMPAP